MTRKPTPIISQSSVKLLKSEAISLPIEPSNSIYYARYPYKVVFNLKFDNKKPWSVQMADFRFDLDGFVADMLEAPTRKYLFSQTPSLFISSYTDLLVTLGIYSSIISHVCGPISSEHKDLLFSPNFRCEGKKKLWYNMYDCKIETWVPFKYRSPASTDGDSTLHSFTSFLKEQINVHEPRSWAGPKYSTTFYCNFTDFVGILPFVKMAHPETILNITKAMVKD